jgi:hypothetical protein
MRLRKYKVIFKPLEAQYNYARILLIKFLCIDPFLLLKMD